MAFHHFHKHKQKYLVVTVAAMVFTMFVFSIPQALQAFTGDSQGKGDSVWLKFSTSGTVKRSSGEGAGGFSKDADGVAVEVTNLERIELESAVNSAILLLQADFARGFRFGDNLLSPAVQAVYASPHATVLHAMLSAEAEAMGIQIPPELVQRRVSDVQDALREAERLAAERGVPDVDGKLTKKEWRDTLDRARLDQARLEAGLAEVLAVELLVRSVEGVDVYDPADVERFFKARHQKLEVEYVAFRAEDFLDAMSEEVPEEDVLAEFYGTMPKPADEYYHPERYTLDVAVVHYDEVDLDALSDVMAAFTPPGDDAWLDLYNRDKTRYGTIEGEVESSEDIPQDIRDKIVLDEKIKFLMETAETAYEAEIARLEAEEEDAGAEDESDDSDGSSDDGGSDDGTPEDGGPFVADPWNQDGDGQDGESQDGGADGAQDSGEESTEEESSDPDDGDEAQDGEPEEDPGPSPDEILDAQQRPVFERVMSEHGLSVTRHEGLTTDELGELDPPGDPNFGFTVGRFRITGDTQVVEAANERRHGYVFRVGKFEFSKVKTLDEVREKVLEAWREDQAGDRAEQAAREFRDGIREKALAAAPPAAVENLKAAMEAELAELGEDEGGNDLFRERQEESIRQEWFLNLGALVGNAEGPLFRQAAQEQGIDLQTIGPFSRSARNHPHFRKLHEGDELFLMGRDSSPFGGAPALLGYGVGCVSDVMEDTQENNFYVAQVISRTDPELSEMTMKQRQEVNNACQRWNNARMGIEYHSRFSAKQLLQHYQPMVRKVQPVDEDASY